MKVWWWGSWRQLVWRDTGGHSLRTLTCAHTPEERENQLTAEKKYLVSLRKNTPSIKYFSTIIYTTAQVDFVHVFLTTSTASARLRGVRNRHLLPWLSVPAFTVTRRIFNRSRRRPISAREKMWAWQAPRTSVIYHALRILFCYAHVALRLSCLALEKLRALFLCLSLRLKAERSAVCTIER